MVPTADSNWSAKRISSSRRAAAPALFCASWVAASRSALATACSLNSSTADGHLADLVLAAEPGQHDVEIAAGEFAHRLAHRDHRPRNATAEQQGERGAEQEAADRQHQDHVLDLGHGGVGFGLVALLVGEKIVLHRARALHDRIGRARHLGLQVDDQLAVFDQLEQRHPVILQHLAGLCQALLDLFVFRGDDRLQRIFDEFEPGLRAGGNRRIAVDDEGIDQRGRRLMLGGHLLEAEFDRRLFRVNSEAGEVVELVAQRHAAPRQLVLHDLRTVLLGLEDLGEGGGVIIELGGELADPFAPRRRRGAPGRRFDRILQAGLRLQRRLGIVFLAGDDIITDQEAVGDQLTVDIAGQIGLGDAMPVGGDTH